MTSQKNIETEPDALAQRYARRASIDGRYSFLRNDVCLGVQERQREMLQLLRQHGVTDLANLQVLEVGVRQPVVICWSFCAWAARPNTWLA